MEAAADLDAALAVLRAAESRLLTATDDELLADGAAIEQLGRLVDAHRLVFAAEAERRTVSPGAALPLAFRHGSRDAVDLVAHVARIDRPAAKRRVALGSALAPEVSLLGEPLPGRLLLTPEHVAMLKELLESQRRNAPLIRTTAGAASPRSSSTRSGARGSRRRATSREAAVSRTTTPWSVPSRPVSARSSPPR